MNHFFSIVIPFEKAKNGSVRFCWSDAPFHWRFNFINFWPKFGPRFWDIFWISGNALTNHFFSIVISFEKAKNGSEMFCGSDAPFHWTFHFFNFWPNFGPRFLDIFRISGNALMNHFFGIEISFEKAKNGSEMFCGSDAPFHWTFNFLKFSA